jgi:hypothetical protein
MVQLFDVSRDQVKKSNHHKFYGSEFFIQHGVPKFSADLDHSLPATPKTRTDFAELCAPLRVRRPTSSSTPPLPQGVPSGAPSFLQSLSPGCFKSHAGSHGGADTSGGRSGRGQHNRPSTSTSQRGKDGSSRSGGGRNRDTGGSGRDGGRDSGTHDPWGQEPSPGSRAACEAEPPSRDFDTQCCECDDGGLVLFCDGPCMRSFHYGLR